MKKIITIILIISTPVLFSKAKELWGVAPKAGGGYECIEMSDISLKEFIAFKKKDNFKIVSHKANNGAISYVAEKEGADSNIFTANHNECLRIANKGNSKEDSNSTDISGSTTEFKLWKEISMMCPENVGTTSKVLLEFSRITSQRIIYLDGYKNDSSPASVFSLEKITGDNPHFDPKLKTALLKLKKGSPVYTEWRSEQVNVRKDDPHMKPKIKCLNILETIRTPTEKEAREFVKYFKSK